MSCPYDDSNEHTYLRGCSNARIGKRRRVEGIVTRTDRYYNAVDAELRMNSPETERVRSTSYPARFAREVAARPAATGFSIICIILFILQARGTAKIDGYGIALLVLASVPWRLRTLGKIADS